MNTHIRSGCDLDVRLEVIEGEYGFADSRRERRRLTGETETVQDLPRGFRLMNCGDDPHHVTASDAL